MRFLSILWIGLLFLSVQETFANDCDGSGDCNVRNVCLKISIDDCPLSTPNITTVFNNLNSTIANVGLSKTAIIHKDVMFRIPSLSGMNYCGYNVAFAQIDFGDGNGFVGVGSGNFTKSVTYTSGGDKNIQVKIFLDFGFLGLKSITKEKTLNVVHNPHNTSGQYNYESPDEIWNIVSDVYAPTCTGAYPTDNAYSTAKYNNTYAGEGNAYIKYANPNDPIIRKPLVVVEGVDFGKNEECDPNTGDIIRYGTLGWDIFGMGLFESHGSQQLQEMPIQLETLNQSGYDIIIVDFKDGVDYIQRNAEVLISILERINLEKDCGAEETIVLGASMGGQVSRIALTKMEQEGTPHEVRTYISFDSPHQGAMVPLSLQGTVWLAAHTMGSAVGDLLQDRWEMLISPAAQQMMYDNLLRAYHNQDISFLLNSNALDPSTYDPNAALDYTCLRDAYVAERAALGYPQQCRNVAVINGSKLGIDQGFDAGDKFVDFDFLATPPPPFSGNVTFTVDLFALNGNSSDMLVDLDIPVINDQYQVRLNKTYPTYDNAPGCFQFFVGDVLTSFGVEPFDITLANTWLGRINTSLSVVKHNTFMPSISTLDVNNTNLNVNIKNLDIIGNNLTPFDDYYAPDANEQHVKITAGNRAWTNTEIGKNTNEVNGMTIGSGFTHQIYNFGGLRKFVNNFTVANGGMVYLNEHSLPVGFSNSTQANPTGQFEAHTGRCSVTVENGGILSIGGVYYTDKATLRVVSGSTLHIKSGGIVRIKGYSQLIIEEGATLIIEDGGMINYWGTGTGNAPTLRIEGTLVVENNGTGIAELVGHGRMQIMETATIDIQDNAHLRLEGSDKAETMLELEEHVDFGVDGSARLTLLDGKVAYNNHSKIIANNGATLIMSEVTLDGSNNTAVEGDAPYQMILDKVDFMDFNIGVNLYNGTTNSSINYMVTNSNFTDCEMGIEVFDMTSFKSTGNTFDGNGGQIGAIWAINTEVLQVSTNTIQNYSGSYAIFLDNVPVCQLRNTLVDNCDYGVYAQNKSNVFLSSQTVMSNNNTAIHLIGDKRDGMVSMNCATLDNNVTGISGTDVLLDIDAEVHAFNSAYISPNVFKNINPNSLLFDICYNERNISTIYAKSNYWDGMTMTSFPSSYVHLYNSTNGSPCLSTNNVVINMSNAYTTEPTGCNYENPNGVPTLPVGTSTTSTSSVQMLANQCTINMNSQTYDVARQYKMGDEKFKEEEFEDADLKYAPVSSLSGTTRDNSSDACRHYIDVAEVMVKVEEILNTQKSGNHTGITNINDLWDETVVSERDDANILHCNISTYPNPASDILNVRLDDLNISGKGRITIYNSLGQIIKTQTTYGRLTEMTVSELPAGLYRLTFVSEAENVRGETNIVVE